MLNAFNLEILLPFWASQVAIVVKNLLANAADVRDTGLSSGLGRSPEEGHGNSLEYPCLENPVNRGAWRARVHGVSRSRTRLSDFHFHSGEESIVWNQTD